MLRVAQPGRRTLWCKSLAVPLASIQRYLGRLPPPCSERSSLVTLWLTKSFCSHDLKAARMSHAPCTQIQGWSWGEKANCRVEPIGVPMPAQQLIGLAQTLTSLDLHVLNCKMELIISTSWVLPGFK